MGSRKKATSLGESIIAPFVDSKGRIHLVETTQAVADLLAEVEPRMKERLFRRPEAIEGVYSGQEFAPDWFRFSHLMGESPTWWGAVSMWEPMWDEVAKAWIWKCRICRGRKLRVNQYCLSCDASGRELKTPGPMEQPRKEGPKEDDGLKGGLGGKQ